MSPKAQASSDGEHTAAEPATTHQTPVLDYWAFPHIVEHIVACASYDVLLTLRFTSRALKTTADAQFPRHLALMPDGCVQARVHMPSGRGPWMGVSPSCVFPPLVKHLDIPSITADCAYHDSPSEPPLRRCDCKRDRNSANEETHPHSGMERSLPPYLKHLDIVRARADACSLVRFSAPTAAITYDFWDQFDRTARGPNAGADANGTDSFSAFLDEVFDIDHDLDYAAWITRSVAPTAYMPPRQLVDSNKLVINLVYRPAMGWPMNVVPDTLPDSVETIVFMLIKDSRDGEASPTTHPDNAMSQHTHSVFTGVTSLAWQALSPLQGSPKELTFVGFSDWDNSWTPEHFRPLAEDLPPERMLATILVNVLIQASNVEEQVARDLVGRNTIWASKSEYCTHVGVETYWLELGF